MTNNNQKPGWQKGPAFENLLFTDDKVPDSSKPLSETVIKALKPLEKSVSTIHGDIRFLKQQLNSIFEQLNQMKSSLNKAVANVLIGKDDWEKIRAAIKGRWVNHKHFSELDITSIIENELALDSDNADNQGLFKVAIEKSKAYLRTSLYKTFHNKVQLAVEEYFRDNPNINNGEDHVNRILTIRNWTKTNPTTSDVGLAKQLIEQLLKDRMDQSDDEPPKKKRKLGQDAPVYPIAKQAIEEDFLED